MDFTKVKKVWFPLFILSFQVAFIILFGTLAEYGEHGGPILNATLSESRGGLGNTSAECLLESSCAIVREYPRECYIHVSKHYNT